MAIVAADWVVPQSTKIINYIGDDHDGGAPSYATVIELHRWLQSLADDAVLAGDDELDITKLDPSRRSTDNIITLINGYTITATAAEHLYDGSIIYNNGDDVYDGFVNFGNPDIQIQIIQNGVVLSDDWWNHRDGVYGDGGLNYDDAAGISHRFLIKTRTSGADIDGRRIVGTARRFGYTYSEFKVNGTSRGNNVLALSDALDLNNQTAAATVATWTTITNENEGYVGLDVNNNGASEFYYSEWNRDTFTVNQFFERMKWLTRDGSVSTLYGLNGELFRGITHEIVVDNPTGTFSAFEAVSWATGSGQMFAINSPTAPTRMWIQLLTGTAPVDGQTITGGTSSATADVNVTVTDRSSTIQTPFIGASTGSAIIGAYGVGIEVADLTSSDRVTDLTGATVAPPNFVTNTVAGLVSGEDRVLVGPWDGSSTDANGDPAINKNQFLLSTALTTDNITAVVIKAGDEGPAIPADTPATGYLRVVDNSGRERRLHYSAWSGSTFTIDTTDGNEDFASTNASVDNNVWLAYIDELASGTTASYTSVQSGSRNLVVVVRDGGASPIRQFISAWTQTTSAQTITAIRTTDA